MRVGLDEGLRNEMENFLLMRWSEFPGRSMEQVRKCWNVQHNKLNELVLQFEKSIV